MKRAVRIIPLALLSVIAIVGIAQAKPHALARQAAATSGHQTLRRSIAVMKRSLHTVHAEALTSSRNPCCDQPAILRTTGDCTTRKGTLTSHFWLRGQSFEQGTTTRMAPLNAHYIVAIPSAGARTSVWKQAPGSKSWVRSNSDDAALEFILLCPGSAYFDQGFISALPTAIQNLGTTHIRGHDTWHLHAAHKSTGASADLYLDRQTGFILRLDYRTNDQRTTVDYSRFNQPLDIPLP